MRRILAFSVLAGLLFLVGCVDLLPEIPAARFTVDVDEPVVGELVTFDGSLSTVDPLSKYIIFEWRVDKSTGSPADFTGAVFTWRFQTPGEHTVSLTVEDSYGQRKTAIDTLQVRLLRLQANIVYSPTDPRVGEAVRFQAIVEAWIEGGYGFGLDFKQNTAELKSQPDGQRGEELKAQGVVPVPAEFQISWSVNNRLVSSSPEFSYVFRREGNYGVTLRVRHLPTGSEASAFVRVGVSRLPIILPPPPPTQATLEVNTVTVRRGERFAIQLTLTGGSQIRELLIGGVPLMGVIVVSSVDGLEADPARDPETIVIVDNRKGLVYDPTVLTPFAVKAAPSSNWDIASTGDTRTGELWVHLRLRAGQQLTNRTQVVLTVEFMADRRGFSPLELREIVALDFDGNQVPLEVVSGRANVR